MSTTVVILGGSYGALTVAHKLLKTTLPAVKGLKVIMISASSHFYWNVASVRAIVPGQLADEKVFDAVAPGFAKYPKGSVEFVLGTATNVDPASKKVTATVDGGSQEFNYDVLVVSTGSRTTDGIPWKLGSTYEETVAALHDIQAKIKAAKSIVVGGAGATGVETAGELGFEYGKVKEITLVTSSEQILPGTMTAANAKSAEGTIKKLNVKIVNNTRVVSTAEKNGQTELTYSNGNKQLVDLYLPTTGLTPNTDFMPKEFLNSSGHIMMDEFLKVKNTNDIWAVGDVVDTERAQVMLTQKQGAHLAKNLDLVLKNKSPVPYVVGGDMIGITLGRSKGAGQRGTSSVPGIIIWFVKRNMLVEKMHGLVTGTGV